MDSQLLHSEFPIALREYTLDQAGTTFRVIFQPICEPGGVRQQVLDGNLFGEVKSAIRMYTAGHPSRQVGNDRLINVKSSSLAQLHYDGGIVQLVDTGDEERRILYNSTTRAGLAMNTDPPKRLITALDRDYCLSLSAVCE